MVSVFGDGVYLGTVPADGSGNWTLPGVAPLPPGTYVSAVATLAPLGTSPWSPPVIVGNIVDMLRSDIITALSQPAAPIFNWKSPLNPSMDPLGANHRPDWGEGALTQLPGSSDDDKAYLHMVAGGDIDPDPTVLTDETRMLVFYQLVDNAHTLKLSKVDIGGGEMRIQFSITP